MIGTKVKVGWDAGSVQSGMKGLIGTIGKGFGAIGRGGLERIGHRMTDTLGRIIAAAPEAIKDLADYGGELSDLSAALEIPVDRLVQLQEAMRLGGAGVDSLRMFAMMAKNIHLANKDGEDLAAALQLIGLRTDKMAAMKPDKQFEAIAEAIQQSDRPVGELIDILSDIFGGRVGMKMLNMFRNFDSTMTRAAKNSSGFARYMEQAAGGLDEMSDALGRWEMLRRGLASLVTSAFADVFGTGAIDKIFDSLDPSGLRDWFRDAVRDGMREVEIIMQGGLGKYLKDAFKMAFDWVWNKAVELIDMAKTKMNDVLMSAIGKLTIELWKLYDSLPQWMKGDSKGRTPLDIFKGGINGMNPFGGPGPGAFGQTTMTTEQASQLIALTKSIERKFGGLATV
jgi:hypothetical protein